MLVHLFRFKLSLHWRHHSDIELMLDWRKELQKVATQWINLVSLTNR